MTEDENLIVGCSFLAFATVLGAVFTAALLGTLAYLTGMHW